tara:strand:- start:17747 stop:18628 length:882 start_codon:yes stop_codon:yes gene_type:complete
MHIGLATCSTLPDWEIDDRPLEDALRAAGATVHHPVWDDGTFDFASLDVCLVRTTWDYEHRRDAFVEWAAATTRQTRFFNPPEVIAWNTHKSYLHDLSEDGIPTIPTVWVERGGTLELRAVLSERGWTRGFLKPVVGSTARATFRFDVRDDSIVAAQSFLEERLASESMMVQPYLERVERHGEESIMLVDGDITHAVRKTPVPGDYRVQDDFGATDAPMQPGETESRLARRIMAMVAERFDVPPLLYGRVDLLRDDDGTPMLNELELVEPSFFFRHAPTAAERLARSLLERTR